MQSDKQKETEGNDIPPSIYDHKTNFKQKRFPIVLSFLTELLRCKPANLK